MTQEMTTNFSVALRVLKEGGRVSRTGWNGKYMWLGMQPPDGGKMTLPFLYMKTADGHLVPWLASQTDLLADDWVILAR